MRRVRDVRIRSRPWVRRLVVRLFQVIGVRSPEQRVDRTGSLLGGWIALSIGWWILARRSVSNGVRWRPGIKGGCVTNISTPRNFSFVIPAMGWEPIRPCDSAVRFANVPTIWVEKSTESAMPDLFRNRTAMQWEYGNRSLWYGKYRNVGISGDGVIIEPALGHVWAANEKWASRACAWHAGTGVRVAAAIAVAMPALVYGHWHCDIFGLLVLWPREVLADAHVVLDAREASEWYVLEMLQWVMPAKRVIVVPACHWVWADVLYDFCPRPILNEWPVVIVNLRRFMEERFRLFSSSNGWRCVLVQRDSRIRFVWNLGRIRREFAQAGPEFLFVEWRTPRHSAKWTVVQATRFFVSLRFMFGVEGSNFVALVYMHKGAVVCEIRWRAIEHWFWTYAAWFVGARMVSCTCETMPYKAPTSKKTGSLDVAQAHRAAAICVGLLRAQPMPPFVRARNMGAPPPSRRRSNATRSVPHRTPRARI